MRCSKARLSLQSWLDASDRSER